MFKPGDKIICIIEPDSNTYLKYGKKYTVKKFENNTYFVNQLLVFEEIPGILFYSNRFILDIKEIRKQKLQKICSK